MVDGGRVVAQKCINDGVTVVWEEFQTMPHCFAQLPGLKELKQTENCWRHWADFIRQAVLDPTSLESSGKVINEDKESPLELKPGSSKVLGGNMSLECAERCMRKEMQSTHEWFQKNQAIEAKL